ncbi:MAG: ATP:cob(I)alamin adenosyltransferase, partial [Nitrososphaerota archaeon]
EQINPLIIKYLNRLSTLLFVLARYINKLEEVQENLWSRKQ